MTLRRRTVCKTLTADNQVTADHLAVLLGSNITKDGKRQWYPVAKFADFGLSITTNPYEALRNTARFLQKGTKVWYPPVSTTVSLSYGQP
jgi:2-methylisocitrate lyase-like PEP mutase family enzyme